MTPDEQEALSRRYTAPMVLQLSSGRFAVFNVKRELCGIFHDWAVVQVVVREESARVIEEPRRARAKLTLTLEDLE